MSPSNCGEHGLFRRFGQSTAIPPLFFPPMEKSPSSMGLLVLALLFSFFSSNGCTNKEKTLAIIKPDGVLHNYTSKIKTVILDSGFSILEERTYQFDVVNAKLFYAEHSGKSFFPHLVEYMTSGPVFVMVLEKPNAASQFRDLIGPTDARKAKVSHPHSIRAMCGLDIERNCIHGSDSPQSAAREISFFFGEMSSGDAVAHDEL